MKRWCDGDGAMARWRDSDGTMVRWRWRDRASRHRVIVIAPSRYRHRVIAPSRHRSIALSRHRTIAPSRYRAIVIAPSHHRVIVIAPSRHRYRAIAPSHHRHTSRWYDGAIVKCMALSGFHRISIKRIASCRCVGGQVKDLWRGSLTVCSTFPCRHIYGRNIVNSDVKREKGRIRVINTPIRKTV